MRTFTAIMAALAGFACADAGATSWDLQKQWSNAANPHGPWTLTQGGATAGFRISRSLANRASGRNCRKLRCSRHASRRKFVLLKRKSAQIPWLR